ncbi:MAG: glutathione S-transferase family protein [Pseudomonadota bacterium]
MTYRLYGASGSRHMLTEMVLAEGGLDYEVELLDIKAGDHRKPAFLSINPMGWIPALATPKDEIWFETPAIGMMLAERHGIDLFPGPADKDRARFLACLFNVTGEVEPAMKRAFYPQRYAVRPDQTDAIWNMAWRDVKDRLALIDTALQDGPFFLGQRYSLADLTLAYWVAYLDQKNGLADIPTVMRLYQAVKARPLITELFAHHVETIETGAWAARVPDA